MSSTNDGDAADASTRFDIVVVGAGIAGLVAAVTAAETGARVALCDSSAPGGRARTARREGFEYNVGPHALYLAGHLHPFLVAHGLDFPGGVPATGPVELLRDGRLWRMRLHPLDILRTPLLGHRSRLRVLAVLARLPHLRTERFIGTSWQAWLDDLPEDVAGLLAMLVRTATYVNAPEAFDAAAALDQLRLALRGVRYIDHGWQTIVDALLTQFASAGGEVTERTVIAVRSNGVGSDVEVETSTGRVVAGAVIVAGLAPDAVERITSSVIVGRADQGAAVHASVLDLATAHACATPVFGVDEPLYLSPHAPIAALAPSGQGLVSLLRYTPDGEVGMSADTVRARLTALARTAGIDEADVLHERYLHRLVVANGFPTASAGGLHGRPGIDALGMPGVFIAGDWVGPTFQLADAASSSGEAAARGALASIRSGRRVQI